MNDYSISDYGIFSNAIATTDACKISVSTAKDGVAACKTIIDNDGVFMGPMADKCVEALTGLDTDCTSIISNLGTMSSYLVSTSQAYQTGDQNASNTVLGTTGAALSLGASANSLAAINNGSMYSYTYNGKTFNATNSQVQLDTYEQYLQKNNLFQNAGLLGNRCDLLSGYYAMDLLRGSTTSRSNMEQQIGGAAYNMNRTVSDVNVEPVKQYIYDELSVGNPVVIQVTQKRSNEGLRHFVTAVGYSSNVTSSADLTPENLLVIDCVDGKIQTLNERNRQLYNQKGKYYAKAPTEEFLAKVNNQKNNTANA